MTTRGKFIVIEGGEGSGKDATIERLKKAYPHVCYTREPGGSPFGEELRKTIFAKMEHADGKTLFGLFWAARADHMRHTVIPALRAGRHVVTNRGDASTYAYQIFAQDSHELKDLFSSVRSVFHGEHEPDLYVFLDVDPEIGLARVSKRKTAKNHFDERKLDFHHRVRKGYREFFRDKPHVIVDANQEIDAVWHDVHAAVAPLLG